MKKEDRAAWLAKFFEENGIALYGRASQISRDLQCAKAVATGWLHGTLPRDMELGMRFCDFYGIDMREWVTGEKTKKVSLETERLHTALTLIRKFEDDANIRWDIEDFIEQVETVMDDPQYHQRSLKDVVDLQRRMKNAKKLKVLIEKTKLDEGCGSFS